MSLPVPGLDTVLARQTAATARFVDVLRRADGSASVPGMTWTVGEVGAHVAGLLPVYERAAEGAGAGWPTLDGPAENARALAETPERDPKALADVIERQVPELQQCWRGLPRGAEIAWHGGLRQPVAVIGGMVLGELLVHGLDIARATKQPWKIEPGDATMVIMSTLHVVEHFVDDDAANGFSATFGLSLRTGPRDALTFDDGRLRVTEGKPPTADCRISAAPLPFLLTSYDRVPSVRAALTGGVVAYGRKPWLAMKFPTMLRSP